MVQASTSAADRKKKTSFVLMHYLIAKYIELFFLIITTDTVYWVSNETYIVLTSGYKLLNWRLPAALDADVPIMPIFHGGRLRLEVTFLGLSIASD